MQPLISSDPEKVSHWKILGRLGSGGMGVVYYAVDFKKSLSNEVALKIIRPHILEDSSARTRLEREISTLYSVDNPYVARIVDSQIDDSSAWIATQRVNGPSLSQWVEDNGPLEFQAWLSFAYGVFSAINAIHSAGIIHRDIKPSNILLEQQGEYLVPKLIDFGIAIDQEATSLTRTGMLVGTPAWLAPEQFSGDAISPAVDIFAIGSTLLYAATGRNPWGIQDTTPIGVIIGTISSGTPNIDGINKEQKKILTLLLNRNPKNRITSSEAMKIIEATATEQGIRILKLGDETTQIDNVVTKSQISRRKLSTKSIGMITVSLILIGVATIAITQTGKNPQLPVAKETGTQSGKNKGDVKASAKPSLTAGADVNTPASPTAKATQKESQIQISSGSAYPYIKALFSEVGCAGAIISAGSDQKSVLPGSSRDVYTTCSNEPGTSNGEHRVVAMTSKSDIELFSKRAKTAVNETQDSLGFIQGKNFLIYFSAADQDLVWISKVQQTVLKKFGGRLIASNY
jgi:serine/threonine protein kinase